MLKVGEIIENKYEVIRLLGSGGMSTVYQAKNLSDGTLLAIKDMERTAQEKDHVVEQNVAAEGWILKNLRNPHLPKIYDIIEKPESFMVVMDYVEGESLDVVVKKNGAQAVDRIYSWSMQICEVFSYLHRQNPPIIYRDMKPANVILQPNGQIMMIDFGTARTQKIGMTMQADTICIGTEGFAAPEQYGGIGQSDARTDIFCLGATIYNLATGHSPYEPPKGIFPLEYWKPEMKDCPLNEIIAKCTRSDKALRYQSAMELWQDLDKARRGVYRSSGRGGRTNAFGRSGQKQSFIEKKGLSGLLGKSQILKQREQMQGAAYQASPYLNAPPKVGEEQPPAFAPPQWQTAENSLSPPAALQETFPNEAQDGTAQNAAGNEPAKLWWRMTLISGIAAIGLLVLTLLCFLTGTVLISEILLIFTFSAAILAGVGAIGYMKNSNNASR